MVVTPAMDRALDHNTGTGAQPLPGPDEDGDSTRSHLASLPSETRGVLAELTRLLVLTPDGPQRDYYVGVRMAVMRNPHHGYELCELCGEPYLPAPGSHTRRMGHYRQSQPR